MIMLIAVTKELVTMMAMLIIIIAEINSTNSVILVYSLMLVH